MALPWIEGGASGDPCDRSGAPLRVKESYNKRSAPGSIIQRQHHLCPVPLGSNRVPATIPIELIVDRAPWQPAKQRVLGIPAAQNEFIGLRMDYPEVELRDGQEHRRSMGPAEASVNIAFRTSSAPGLQNRIAPPERTA